MPSALLADRASRSSHFPAFAVGSLASPSWRSRCGWSGRSSKVLSRVEQDGDRPGVDELELHVRPKPPRLHAHASAPAGRAKRLEQQLRRLGRHGLRKTRAPPLTGVAEQRKLRHREELAADLPEVEVHLAVLVLEDA